LHRVLAIVVLLAVAGACWAQSAPAPAETGQSPFFGSTPSGPVTPGVMQLTVLDAIDRGLRFNLGMQLSATQTDAARAARMRALSDLLPKIDVRVGESVQQINPQQFGLTLPGMPDLIGPFSLFDTRAVMTGNFELRSLNNTRASSEALRASEQADRNAREMVVLAVGATYLRAIAAGARVESVQAQLTTAQTLLRQATDMKNAGVVPGIDVLRAQVEERAERQRLVAARNDFAKAKLTLGRVI
jgi:outer membrane protein TolC